MPDDNSAASDASSFKERIGVGQRQPTSKHRGGSNTTPVVNENTGGVAGTQTEKWDGRVAADVFAPVCIVKPRAQIPGKERP